MKIAIFGGDRRMLHAGQLLRQKGYECVCFAFDGEICGQYGLETTNSVENATHGASAIILPLPCEKNGVLNAPFSKDKTKVCDIFAAAERNTLFLGGRIPQNSENTVDYSEREEFKLRNAIPTAEGAVAIAMSELETTLYGASATVLGYGRIGGYLAGILKSLGMNVTAVARSLKSRAQAEIAGIKAVGFDRSEAPLAHSDIVFNTVPFKVIGENELNAIKKGTPVIDLASSPGGADREECEKHGIKLISALALPGKVAPITAGEIIFKTVLSILTERGITP